MNDGSFDRYRDSWHRAERAAYSICEKGGLFILDREWLSEYPTIIFR